MLVILASISIGAVFSEKGIIQQAKDAKKTHEDARRLEEENLNDLLGEYKNSMNGTGESGSEGGGTTKPTPTPEPTPSVPTGPNGNQLVSSITDTNHNTIEAEDSKGNKVVVPGGFKIAEDSGSSVKEGIVVEDSIGNQFVWIPVSNINHDGSNKIKIDDKDEVGTEITLGRYTFSTSSPGTETLVQYANTYNTVTTAQSQHEGQYQELPTARESTSASTNTTAKDLKGFVESVERNHGYFIARYEASYGSGSEFGIGENDSYYKPASKKTTAFNTGSMNYVAGTLWNGVTQPNAAKAGRQMYYGNSYLESDLINSYMWDTAIIYIQAMGNANYANANSGSDTSLKNTGETGDEKCHIFDMAFNVHEWTTEFCTYSSGSYYMPCVERGTARKSGYSYRYTAGRDFARMSWSSNGIGFRVGLWLK